MKLVDVDLDAPTSPPPTRLVDELAEAKSPTTASHRPQSAPALASVSAEPSANGQRQRTLRARASYHFSLKRPRRNVVQRSIASLPDIDEEKELPGTDASKDRGHDPLRAPKLALVLFALLVSAGGYRGIDDYRTARESMANESAEKLVERNADADPEPSEEGDLSYSLRGAADGEHRGALMLASDGVGEGDGNMAQSIEDIPNLLPDGTAPAPEGLSNLANVVEARYNPRQHKLFLWHIPRSGATSIAHIASQCMGLALASDVGKKEAKRLRVLEGSDGLRYANVDLSNLAGIAHAKTLGVGQSDQIDLMSSPFLWESAGLFDETHKGFAIAMMRHPIERAASLYYSMKKSPRYEKKMASLDSIEQYSKSSWVENNWMTRFLSNTLSGELTPEHEAMAKEVLRTKCIVGLLRDKTETLRRMSMLFDLHSTKQSQERDECEEKLLYWDWAGKNRHPPVVEGSEAWDNLHKQNAFDLRVYEYAERLFVAQRKLFEGSPTVG